MARPRSRIRSARLNIRSKWILGFFLCIAAVGLYLSLTVVLTAIRNEAPRPSAEKVSVSTNSSQVLNGPHPLDRVLTLAKNELASFNEQVIDYTALMLKRERVGDKLGEANQLFVKIINPRSVPDKEAIPLHCYLRFESPSSVKGREVIWVDGKNDGNMIAHEAGMLNLMRVYLPPTGTLAMLGNKYPITGIGMGNLFSKLIEKGERDRKLGDCQVAIKEHEKLDELDVVMIEVKHPVKRLEFDFHIARIYLDTLRHLPVRYESYLWPKQPGDEPPLEEQYIYSDIKLNVRLSEKDFDPENNDYHFP